MSEPDYTRHADNPRVVTCPECGNQEATEYDIAFGATAEEREANGIASVEIVCGACNKTTTRKPEGGNT